MNNKKYRSIILEPQSRMDMELYGLVPRNHKIYEVKFKDYTTFVSISNEDSGGFSSNLYTGKNEHAGYINGTFSIPISHADVDHMKIMAEDASKKDKIRYVIELTAATETTLAKHGIEVLRGSTHDSVTHILKNMGWKETGQRDAVTDLEKNIHETGVIIPKGWDF